MFKEDLEQWKRFERYIETICNKIFWLKVWENPDIMWVDLLWDNYSIEIKYDIGSTKTGNYFIETSYKWERSWIFKYNADFFCIWTQHKFWIYDRQELVSLIGIHGRPIIWWDNNDSKWVLIKIEDIFDLAIYKYDNTKL